MNSTFLSRSLCDFMPSPHAIWITLIQLQHPSTQAAMQRAQEKRQYFSPFMQLSIAGPDYPHLQSIQMGAHRVQQQALQKSCDSPQASMECHWSMQLATLQAHMENQQHWQHFFRKSAIQQNLQSIIHHKIMPPLNAHQLLRARKAKERKVASYRKKRIVSNYRKQANTQAPQDQHFQRQFQFYDNVFKQEEKQTVPKAPKGEEEVADRGEKKERLKQKKKKLVKKMKREKTSKGQPLMRNYIKYALTNLQLDLEREKGQKKDGRARVE